MDQATPIPQVQSETPVQQTQLKPEQLERIKQSLIDSLLSKYNEFLQFLHSLPGHLPTRQNAFKDLDTGFLWIRESIINLRPEHIQIAPMPVAPPQENKNAESMASAAPQTEIPSVNNAA